MSPGPITYRELAEIDVERIKGVGTRKREALEGVGITSVLDLLTHYPRRYLDRTKEATLDELSVGDEAVVMVRVDRVGARRTRNRRMLVTVDASDATGRLRLTFFNQPWRERQLAVGTEVLVYGKLDTYQGQRQMTNPVVDLVGDQVGRIVPAYPQSEKARITTLDYAGWVANGLERTKDRGIADPVPEELLRRWGLGGREEALEAIHRPEAMADVVEARTRLVFDELLRVQLALVLRKRALERTSSGITHTTSGELVDRFHDRLPFTLTRAQQRTIAEIHADLAGRAPMHRLLQGDVGSGKTVVAVSALLTAVEGGYQGALMAPTEVLAEQHHLCVAELLAGLVVPDVDEGSLLAERPVLVEMLTNRTPAGERARMLGGLATGAVDVVIGTHALIQEGVDFRSLGVVVIDEQHRFGVEQRAALRAKSAGGNVPDVLVMTATPIPRTAAMTVYGDLDVSTLDELPPGRTPVETVWVEEDAGGLGGDEAVWERVLAEVAEGRQAYVVCPLIEESDKLDASSAEETYDELTAGPLAELRVGLLHGRVTAGEKEKVMDLFRAGRLDVLVATTVIEVGIDVPNATVMVVLDADRFGIAQLHQLRGRVGRGADRSWCFLVGSGSTRESEERLRALVRTTDGFELAEVDLDLRGEGTLMGERQTGRNDLKLASLRRDREWVERAREAAFELVDGDPRLAGHPLLVEEVELLLGPEDADFLLKS